MREMHREENPIICEMKKRIRTNGDIKYYNNFCEYANIIVRDRGEFIESKKVHVR